MYCQVKFDRNVHKILNHWRPWIYNV